LQKFTPPEDFGQRKPYIRKYETILRVEHNRNMPFLEDGSFIVQTESTNAARKRILDPGASEMRVPHKVVAYEGVAVKLRSKSRRRCQLKENLDHV